MRFNRIIEALLNYFGVSKEHLISMGVTLSDIVWHIDEVEHFIDTVPMTDSEKLIFYMFLCPRITHERKFNCFDDRLWIYEEEKISYGTTEKWSDPWDDESFI